MTGAAVGNRLTRPAAAGGWERLAGRATVRRRVKSAALYGFLVTVSVPLLIPYVWLVTRSFSSGDPAVLWRTVAVLAGVGAAVGLWAGRAASARRATVGYLVIAGAAAIVLAMLIGPDLHLRNFRFLLVPPFDNVPSVWSAFGNSLYLAGTETVLVVAISSLAGYYLSRFRFPGRRLMFGALLALHAFPVVTLLIPLFLMAAYAGLIDRLVGVILVLVAFELPFAIFIMKGFFDAVPWEIEMAAMVDGATRRQAFVRVVLPQVVPGMAVVAVFAFIRGWEEYIFVLTFLIRNTNWTMSLYLFFTDNAPAVALFYLIPSMTLFLFAQPYLARMSVGTMR